MYQSRAMDMYTSQGFNNVNKPVILYNYKTNGFDMLSDNLQKLGTMRCYPDEWGIYDVVFQTEGFYFDINVAFAMLIRTISRKKRTVLLDNPWKTKDKDFVHRTPGLAI